MAAGATNAAPVPPASPVPPAAKTRAPRAPHRAPETTPEASVSDPKPEEAPKYTHAVTRPFGGYQRGDKVDTSSWRPRNVQAHVNIGNLSPI